MGPCTPRGIMELFNRYGTPLFDQRVPVEGSSRTLGLPLSHKYMRRLASVHADPVLACAAGGSCKFFTPNKRLWTDCLWTGCQRRATPSLKGA